MISDEAKGRARRLLESKVKRDELKQALKDAEKEFREREAEFYEELEDATGGKTLPINLGEPWGTVKFRTRETYYGKIIDQDAAQDWFEQRAMIDEVSSPKFVMARINEIVRERIDLGQPMPPGIDFSPNRGVTISREKD
jgi:hypothetical protein